MDYACYPGRWPGLGWTAPFGAQKHVATASALVTVGFSFDDEPTVNSNDELRAATSTICPVSHHPLTPSSAEEGSYFHNLGAVRTVTSALVASHFAQLGHQVGVGLALPFLVRRQCTRRGRQAVPLLRKPFPTSGSGLVAPRFVGAAFRTGSFRGPRNQQHRSAPGLLSPPRSPLDVRVGIHT